MSQPQGSEPTPCATSRRSRVIRFVLWSLLFWTALGVVFAALLHFAGLSWRVALEWSLPRWYTWGLLTPAVFWLDRRLIDLLALGWRVALHVPLAVAWTSFAILLRLTTRPLRGAALPEDVAAFFLEHLYGQGNLLRVSAIETGGVAVHVTSPVAPPSAGSPVSDQPRPGRV